MPTTAEKKPRKNKKRIIALPGEYHKRVKVPNNVVSARYSYTLLQERIFNYVLYYLQCYTKQVMDGTPIRQLDIFTQPNDMINIVIPMGYIAAPAYYQLVRESAEDLAGILVELDVKGENGKEMRRVRGLFSYVETPKEHERTNKLTLQVSKDVAAMLINVDRNRGGDGYTSFLLEVTLAAKNKYTPRLYKFISSWANRGGKDVTTEQLRDMLQLGDKYPDHNSFMRRVLKPVAEDLDRIGSDCWFEVAPKTDGGKKVVGYTFKIINETRSFHYVKLKNNAIDVLRTHFNLKQEHIKQLQEVIEVVDNYGPLMDKIMDLYTRGIMQDATIKFKEKYIVDSILRHFRK